MNTSPLFINQVYSEKNQIKRGYDKKIIPEKQ